MSLPRFALVLLLLLLPLGGCGFLDGEDGAATDSTAVAPDSLVADSLAATGDSSPQAVRDTTAPGDTLLPDTLAAVADTTEATLTERLARLEAQNDSLRNTILGLVALQAGRETRARSDTAGTATEILGRGAEQARSWGLRIFLTILFLIFTAGLIRALVWVLDQLAERNAKRRLFFKRLVPIARILLWALAFPFAALVILGIDAQGILAAGAAIGVAVGFAAQDILKNIFGGIIVLFDQPFQVGDKVAIHGTYGEVVSIGLRSTRIVTPDDNLVTVPNAQVVGDQVANANAGELNCQVVTDLWLPGWVDEAKAKRIAFEAATSSKYVYLNKPIVVLVKDEFKETFLTHLKVKAYVLDPRYEFLFMSDVTERARAGFRSAGLLGPLHGVRAYVDMDRFPGGDGPDGGRARGPSPSGTPAGPPASPPPSSSAAGDGEPGGTG